MVFYRKYRPQKIADLDSAIVREKLTGALTSKNIPHAFLFTGPKGLGKTSTARIVAKAVNCERNSKQHKTIEPCNGCDQCLSTTNGTNLDVLEIDAASNRGIDEIRDLQGKINLAPFKARKKIYIIDEVHMLTTEAFNALLKTLEEPPSHVLFILCTTELHKVPATIVSRCFQISFTRATDEELVHSFQRILEGEKLQADEEALFAIAKLSDGSFRDGAKALEEMVALANGKKITKALVNEKYKISTIGKHIEDLLASFVQRDAKKGFEIVQKVVDQGIDIKYFVEQLIGKLHTALLVQVGVLKETRISNVRFTIQEIKDLVTLLSKAHGEIKYAVLSQLPLELVVVEWSLGASINDENTEVAHENFLVAHAKDKDSKIQSSSANSHNENFVSSPRQESTSSSLSSGQPTNSSVKGEKDSRDFWFAFLDEVKKENHTIAGVLRGCRVKSRDDKEIVIEAPYKFHKEKLEKREILDFLEKAVLTVTGKKSTVLVVLKG